MSIDASWKVIVEDLVCSSCLADFIVTPSPPYMASRPDSAASPRRRPVPGRFPRRKAGRDRRTAGSKGTVIVRNRLAQDLVPALS